VGCRQFRDNVIVRLSKMPRWVISAAVRLIEHISSSTANMRRGPGNISLHLIGSAAPRA
jgi:hypothetical protein